MNATAIQILSASISDYSATTTARVGKVEATVSIYENMVMVYKAHPGLKRIPMGKQFPTIAAAIESYKSPEMKAILAAADKLNS